MKWLHYFYTFGFFDVAAVLFIFTWIQSLSSHTVRTYPPASVISTHFQELPSKQIFRSVGKIISINRGFFGGVSESSLFSVLFSIHPKPRHNCDESAMNQRVVLKN